MYKLINKKSFYLILAAIVGYWAFQIVSLIINLSNIDKVVDDMIANPIFESLYSESDREMLRSTTIFSTIIGAVIVIGLSSIFLFKLLGHRKRPQKGTYLTVMLVFAAIIGGVELIYLIGGDLLALGLVAVLGLVVAGYVIQKNDNLTPYAETPQPFSPYGQNNFPYGQNNAPYGQNQYPYGQQPYNQPFDPYDNRYQQPQNPYSGVYQPPQNPYNDPQNPDGKKDQ